MNIKDLYWLAGIIEGEGSFMFTQDHYPRVKVKMTDEDIVRRCHAVAGVGTVSGPHQYGTRKPSWTWVVQKTSDAAGLMMTLYSLMGERRQAKILETLGLWRRMDYPRCGSNSSSKMECPEGHPYDEENTFKNNQGRRVCRTCKQANGRKADAKRRPRRKVGA